MQQAQSAIAMASLKRAEQMYRTRLANEPNDSGARIKLAWCLFMQALYRAGQESMLDALLVQPEDGGEKNARTRCIWDQSADDLIRECLCEAGTVIQLSSDAACRSDARRLQALVKMSGGEQAVTSSRENSSRILVEVLQELLP
ncbi:MAG: hypothetical protein KY468_07105 [Armatimonadetes bacterium]|nr:hypothetical protein [Armatimonadota bacterium]